MDAFGWTPRCLTRNGRPWFPVMGEMHFSRLPAGEWPEALAVMAAGGVTVVSTYVFWLHHEPAEGTFDFAGRRSLRAFLAACRDAGMLVWLRIGPWCHGEAKNGGFPDWLMAKGWPLRSNDPRYLAKVRAYWARLYAEADGYLHAQGGPVIGVQLENEYGHCGGDGGPRHMDTLLTMAKEAGFSVPYYSATAWGGALLGTTGEVLPVMGAYCDAPWDASLAELPANGNYLFSHERNDVDIGGDFRPGEHLTFDPARYPYLTAELAGGMGGTRRRRPYVTAADIGAMTLCKLGSGVSMLGYYLYHGGTNPGPGLHESRASGGNCDWPEMSYDLRSPVGEYGQIRRQYNEIKLFALFLRDFGETLAPLPAVLPDRLPNSPEDTRTPRYAFRIDGERGYLFVNHHQRKRTLVPQTLRLSVPLRDGPLPFPAIRLRDGGYAFYPINLRLGGATLISALATPLCVLNGQTYVFYADGDPHYRLRGEAELMTLSREEALNAYKIDAGQERLVVADAPVVRMDGRYWFLTRKPVRYTVYADAYTMRAGVAEPLRITRPAVECTPLPDEGDAACFAIRVRYGSACEDCYLRVDYAGAEGRLFLDGECIADDFYDGHPWEIGLRRYGDPARLTIRIYPLYESDPVLLDRPPAVTDGRARELRGISVEALYRLPLPDDLP